MTRYVTRAALIRSPSIEDMGSIFSHGSHNDYACEVTEAPAYRDTGLLDASGQTIWATDKGPLGFGDGR